MQTKRTPIFRKLLIPLMLLVVLEILILVCTLFGQGLISELRENEQDVLKGRVVARKNYLESVMVNDWMNLGSTVEKVTATAERLLAQGQLSLDTLDDDSASCAPLLTDAAPHLLEMLRANRVTGAYIIINTQDLSGTLESDARPEKPGIYLLDSDPTSIASERNEDIMIQLSPREVVRQLRIATDVSWDVRFRFGGARSGFYKSLYHPFQTAYENTGAYRWQDMGYWASPDGMTDHSNASLSYSVPLVLEDGSVIGVLGVELTRGYLSTLLPFEELNDEGEGAYFLAQYDEKNRAFSHVFGFGNTAALTAQENGSYTWDEKSCHLYCEPLRIYNSNTPFSTQQWVLAGMLPHPAMMSFTRSLIIATIIAVTAALVIGLIASIIMSFMIQHPVARLAQEMRMEDPASNILLEPTGILEIDQMSDEVMRLSRDVLESGRKFSRIIEMASVHLAGFEIDREKNSLFLTENFFTIFGQGEIPSQGMTVEAFRQTMEQFRHVPQEHDPARNGDILHLFIGGKKHFIMVRILHSAKHIYGLVEDVTQSLLEKQIIKYERDHDSLTGLHNRRAFQRQVQSLLDAPSNRITIGALVMIDLDNMKYINDTYGHEYGDRYLKQAAWVIDHCLDKDVCHARISGDEFNLFVYGYGSRAEIDRKLQQLKKALSEASIVLPDGKVQRLSATGGVAWYPQDSAVFEDLSKYADYAMYHSKNISKGDFQYFDMEMFLGQDIQMRHSAALSTMIAEKKLHYAFQPIVDVRTGSIYAYEALLRPDIGNFFTAKDVMDTARREGKLTQIEELTWTVGMKNFEDLINAGHIAQDACLFVNSIPTQRLSDSLDRQLLNRYRAYGPRLIIELTEDERMDPVIWQAKVQQHKLLGGRIALDDYGAGYNSETALLSLSPDFIKVDLEIVRDIHLDPDKRTIMEYIINFAHTRGKQIIAEGVESAEEVRTVVALGVDYIQGYFFSRAKSIPNGISPEARDLLLELRETR